jgi:hypothetical protein
MSHREKAAHTGHRGNGGIQEHSCGEIMPWTIVLKGCGFPSQHIYAMNGSTGEVLSSWGYDSIENGLRCGYNGRSFSEAHQLATAEAAARLEAEALKEAA